MRLVFLLSIMLVSAGCAVDPGPVADPVGERDQFHTGTAERAVIARRDSCLVYVEGRELRYAAPGSAPVLLHEWEVAAPGRVWRSGDHYVVAVGDDRGGRHNTWLSVDIGEAEPVVRARWEWYCPRNVVLVRPVTTPALLLFTAGQDGMYYDMAYIASRGEFKAVGASRVRPDDSAAGIGVRIHRLAASRLFLVTDGRRTLACV